MNDSGFVVFFFTLVAGPGRSLSLKFIRHWFAGGQFAGGGTLVEAMLSPKVEGKLKASGEEGEVALAVNSSSRSLTRPGNCHTLTPTPQILNPQPQP